ncbi:phosphoribosylformylglycinamidine synthase-associated small membrane protein [Roseibium sp. RKSG952]|nr:phosphoribosylformylglycinamidine synthase-associated small membrane protein [Roseibium sp. RKSG952]MTH95740.1 phosphoribosylformylglycinamidine synthase [Roseibium sp. RKSG952]
MDEDAAKAMRFMAIKAAIFVLFPAFAAVMAVLFLL